MVVEECIRYGGISEEYPIIGYIVSAGKGDCIKDCIDFSKNLLDRYVFENGYGKVRLLQKRDFLFYDELAILLSSEKYQGVVDRDSENTKFVDYSIVMMYTLTINEELCRARNVLKSFIECEKVSDLRGKRDIEIPKRLLRTKKNLEKFGGLS